MRFHNEEFYSTEYFTSARPHHRPEHGSFDRGRHERHGGSNGHGNAQGHEGPRGHGGPRGHRDGQGHGGPQGFGGAFGRGGHGRHDMHSGRKLSSSDLQLVLLALLADRAAHGYELIKLLDDHSHGLYVPSPGMIYPALTYLEEIGFASVETIGAKKSYSLTDAGRSHYDENRELATHILSEMERIGAQMAQARQAMENLSESDVRDFRQTSEELESARHGLRKAQGKNAPYTADESRGIAEILNRAAAEIRKLLAPTDENA